MDLVKKKRKEKPVKQIYYFIVSILLNGVSFLAAAISLLTCFLAFGDETTLIGAFAFYTVFFFSIAIFIMMLNKFVTARRFDPLFKEILLSDPDMNSEIYLYRVPISGKTLIHFGWVRGQLYSGCIVFGKYMYKISAYEKWFQHYNFRKNARWIDIVMSYLFVIFGALFCLFMLMLSIASALEQIFGI